METLFTRIEELTGHFKEYVDNRIAVVKLRFAEKASAVVAGLLASLAVVFIFVCFIVFASVALAFVLSALIGKMYAGFLIVAGLYLLAAIIIWWGKEKLLRLPIMNAIIQKIFDKEKEDEKI